MSSPISRKSAYSDARGSPGDCRHRVQFSASLTPQTYYPEVQSSVIMQAASTISIRADLKDQLAALKRHPKESYNDVIARLVTLAVDEERSSEETLAGLEESLEDVRKGNLIPEKVIMKKYGMK
jgi:predicted CopG family antitoxin